MVQTATQKQLPPIENTHMVPLTSLVHIRDTEIEGAENALRDQTSKKFEANAKKLRETFETLSQEEWPPIETTQIGNLFVVLDGYTRWEAAKEGKQNVERDKEGNTLNEGTPIDSLPANVRSYSSDEAIVRAAYDFNKAHGNPYTDGEKGTFALYLYDLMTEQNNGIPPSLREVAREADFSHVLLWKRLKKREKDAKKKNQGEEEGEGKSTSKSDGKMVKRLTSLLKNDEMRIEAESVKDASLVDALSKAMGEVTFDDIKFLRRLSSTLVKTANKLEKSTFVQSTIEGQIETSEPEEVKPEEVKPEEAEIDAMLTPAKKGTSKKAKSTRKKETPSLVDEMIDSIESATS